MLKTESLTSLTSKPRRSITTSDAVEAVHFKVYGKVQGVFFRKHTSKQATLLNLKGWVRNNDDAFKTVEGIVQGSRKDIDNFKTWVSKVGSPKSRIDRCEFKRKTVDESLVPFEVKR